MRTLGAVTDACEGTPDTPDVAAAHAGVDPSLTHPRHGKTDR